MKLDVLEALIEARSRRDVPFLLDALRDPEHRMIAAQHLGELRADEAVKPLIRLLRAGHVATRSSACEALGRLGAREAVPDLVELAREDDHLIPRTFAITALGAIGDDRALGPLCELLTDQNILVRQSAATALGVLGSQDAVEPLALAAKQERWYSRRIHKKSIRRITTEKKRDEREGLRDGGGRLR